MCFIHGTGINSSSSTENNDPSYRQWFGFRILNDMGFGSCFTWVALVHYVYSRKIKFGVIGKERYSSKKEKKGIVELGQEIL